MVKGELLFCLSIVCLNPQCSGFQLRERARPTREIQQQGLYPSIQHRAKQPSTFPLDLAPLSISAQMGHSCAVTLTGDQPG